MIICQQFGWFVGVSCVTKFFVISPTRDFVCVWFSRGKKWNKSHSFLKKKQVFSGSLGLVFIFSTLFAHSLFVLGKKGFFSFFAWCNKRSFSFQTGFEIFLRPFNVSESRVKLRNRWSRLLGCSTLFFFIKRLDWWIHVSGVKGSHTLTFTFSEGKKGLLFDARNCWLVCWLHRLKERQEALFNGKAYTLSSTLTGFNHYE